jgi:predicted ATPase
MLAERTKTSHDLALVIRMQLTLYTTLGVSDRGVEVFLDFLRRNGTDWPPHPTREDAMREYERIWTLLGDRQIEDLIDLPLMTDPDVLDMIDVFTEIVPPAFFYDENLSSLVICRMVTLSLEYGNCDPHPSAMSGLPRVQALASTTTRMAIVLANSATIWSKSAA